MKRLWAVPVLFLGLVLVGCDNASTSTSTASAESARPQVKQVEVPPGVEQVVVFQQTNNPDVLQNEVNAWLRQNHGKVEIVRVLQSQSGRLNYYVTITIFYKKTG